MCRWCGNQVLDFNRAWLTCGRLAPAGSSNSKSLEEIGWSFAIWITEIKEGGRFERPVTMLSSKQDRESGNRIPVKTASNFPIEVKLH